MANRRRIAGATVLSLVAAGASVAQPLALQHAVEAVEAARPIAAVVAVLVGVSVLGAAARAFQFYLLQTTAEGVVLGLRTALAHKLLRLPIHEVDRRRQGDLISRAGSDTTLLRNVVTSGVFDIASASLVFLGAIAVMAYLDPVLLGTTAFLVFTATAVAVRLGTRIRAATLDAQERLGSMTARLERALSALRTVRASGATDREALSVSSAAQEAYTAGVRSARIRAAIQPVMGLSVQSSFLIVLFLGGMRVASGAIGLGDLVAFVFYLFLLVAPLSQAMTAFSEIQGGMAALDRIGDVLRLDDEESGTDRTHRAAAAHAVGGEPAIEFDDVHFTYPDGPDALRGVSLRAERGRTTAVVGPSGAGKSTILSLVERFYDPGSGTIRIDGTDASALGRARLRSRLGYLEQSAPALAGTLAENLRLRAPEATDHELKRALSDVGLDDVVDRSPEGLDTPVGDGGVLLSGGQRQRLAWARVLMGSPEILLMDEPTSSVDSRTEDLLQRLLHRASAGRTLVVVAHRLATVAAADRIIVLDRGRVQAVGTHEQLLENSVLYRDLASHQLLAAPSAAAAPSSAFPDKDAVSPDKDAVSPF